MTEIAEGTTRRVYITPHFFCCYSRHHQTAIEDTRIILPFFLSFFFSSYFLCHWPWLWVFFLSPLSKLQIKSKRLQARRKRNSKMAYTVSTSSNVSASRTTASGNGSGGSSGSAYQCESGRRFHNVENVAYILPNDDGRYNYLHYCQCLKHILRKPYE